MWSNINFVHNLNHNLLFNHDHYSLLFVSIQYFGTWKRVIQPKKVFRSLFLFETSKKTKQENTKGENTEIIRMQKYKRYRFRMFSWCFGDGIRLSGCLSCCYTHKLLMVVSKRLVYVFMGTKKKHTMCNMNFDSKKRRKNIFCCDEFGDLNFTLCYIKICCLPPSSVL